MSILIGIILIIVGFLVSWKTNAIVGFMGRSAWADRNLGAEGGTYLLYKFIGIVVIFFGLLAVTGLYNSFLGATVGQLFSPKSPKGL